MDREVTTSENGSTMPNQRDTHADNNENPFIMEQSTLEMPGTRIFLPSSQPNPSTIGGKYPYSREQTECNDSMENMGPNHHHRPASLQRGHKTTGGVRLAPTPTNPTFPAFEDDTKMLDMQTTDSSFGTPLRSRIMSLQGRDRVGTNASQVSFGDESNVGEASPIPSSTLPSRQEEQTGDNANGGPSTRQQVLAFMRAEIDAFNSKGRAKSDSKPFVPFIAPALLSKVKSCGFDDVPGSAVGEEYNGMNGLGEVQDINGIDNRGMGKGNDVGKAKAKENLASPPPTPTRKSARVAICTPARRSPRQKTLIHDATLAVTQKGGLYAKPTVISPLKCMVSPSPTPPASAAEHEAAFMDVSGPKSLSDHFRPKLLINFSVLLETHLDAFPALYATYPTLRARPWDIIELRDRLPPIEWNDKFRLKLDLFVEHMDWVQLRDWGGLEREEVVQLLRWVLDSILERQDLIGPVKKEMGEEDVVRVVVRTIRVERVIDALEAGFSEKRRGLEEKRDGFSGLIKPVFASGMERDVALRGFRQIDGSVATSSVSAQGADHWLNRKCTEKEKERCRIKWLENATYLLTWLWFLEAVPDEVLSGIDVARVGRVFRTRGDRAVVPSGAVVLMRE